MRSKSWFMFLVTVAVLFFTPVLSAECPGPLLEKAKLVFGEPLNAEHCVFALSHTNAVWLVVDAKGELVEVVVGPKSHYKSEFPDVKSPASQEFLSDEEYEEALRRISEVKSIGAMQKRHASALWSFLGAFSTDFFENAAVDRIVGDVPADLQNEAQHVKRFDLHFFGDISGSPKEVLTDKNKAVVCLGDQWYYFPAGNNKPIRLGKWQTLHVAGPSMLTTSCTRTAPLYDADGFTIEEYVSELIEMDSPYSVRELAGRVHIGGEPLKDVDVEVKREGSQKVLRTKTDEEGNFRFAAAREGRYKFKVTKRLFKALTGTVVIDHRAAKGNLSFELPVST